MPGDNDDNKMNTSASSTSSEGEARTNEFEVVTPKISKYWTKDRAILKAKYSFYSTLVFFLIANPETIRLLGKLVSPWVDVVEPGCPTAPTATGFFVQTAAFFCVMWGLMLWPGE